MKNLFALFSLTLGLLSHAVQAAPAQQEPTQAAFEIMTLSNNSHGTIGVIVLSYNGDKKSLAGEFIFDLYLRGFLRNRYSALYVVRGQWQTAESVQAAVKAALDTGRNVDFMTCTHSGPERIKLNASGWITPFDLLSPVINDSNRHQLSLAMNFGCQSETQATPFLALGFKGFVGHQGNSVGVLAMRGFLKNWLKRCDSVDSAASRTNTQLHRFFSHRVVHWFRKKYLSEPTYDAVLKGFGEEVSACQ